MRKISPVIRRAVLLMAMALASSAAGGEVNLYTDRQEIFLRTVLDDYRERSGDIVNVLFVKKGLLERVKAESDASPADVFLLADIGRLSDFAAAGFAAQVDDAEINAAVPKSLRDTNGEWFAVTRRVRALFAAPGTQIKSYEELAQPKYKGAICLRSGAHPYNNALFADLAARNGTDATRQWLVKIKDNLARKPRGNDRAQINAVASGECKIGIANSYYYFHLLHNADDERRQKLQQKTAMLFPQNPHINITGMMRAKNAPHPQTAQRLMRFLIGKSAQHTFAAQNFEFPARNDIVWPPPLSPYREAVQNATTMPAQTAKWRRTASELTDETGFDR